MFISRDHLNSRLDLLKRLGCTLLRLPDAIDRLNLGTLPACAVALTFDDAFYDFFAAAYPVLRDRGVAATVFSTGARVLSQEPPPHLVESYSRFNAQSARTPRILGMMTRDEIKELSNAGVSFCLHSHSHSTYTDEISFVNDIAQNRAALAECEPEIFAYPSNRVVDPEWLAAAGIRYAFTCGHRLCTPDNDPALMPRFVDNETISDPEFCAWITGMSDFLR